MFRQFCIIGTTASGKTDLALQIAREFNGIILSLDSLSIYRYIDIASAKPSKDDLKSVKHFGIDLINPDENFSVGRFFEIYKQARDYAKKQNKILIITGGSGFYLKAMMSGLTPDVPKYDTPDNAKIYELITQIDPEFKAKFSQNDTYRLQKWFCIYKFSNQKPSLWIKNNTQEPILKEIPIFEILWDVKTIRERIEIRTKNMLKNGLLDEAKWLFKRYDSDLKPLKSIGLKECGEFFSGKISSQNELETLIFTHTAQLAKRQRTFNRSAFLEKISGDLNFINDEVRKFLKF